MSNLAETLRRIEREQGTILERVDGVKEDVAEVKEDVAALKADVAELKAAKRAGMSWIAGALAAAAFALQIGSWLLRLAPIVLLAGCGNGPFGADAYWHEHARPVTVYIDRDMRPECVANVLDAVDYWHAHGVDYLRPRLVPGEWDGFNGTSAPRGTITVKENTLPLEVLGVTNKKFTGQRMRWARIRLARDGSCPLDTAAHELGHALGLVDIWDDDYASYLMFWTSSPEMLLTDFERFWVTQ